MKEKEKSKHNPFVEKLRPDEEILWLYSQPPLPFGVHLSRYSLRASGTILLLAFVFGIFISLFGLTDLSNPMTRPEEAVGRLVGSILIALAVLTPVSIPVFAIIFGFLRLNNPYSFHSGYAVTTQRLLVRRDDSAFIEARSLEEMEELRTHKRAVAFVETFVQAQDVEEVAHLLEKTRNHLLEQEIARHQAMLTEAPITFEVENLSRQAKG